MKGMMDIPVTQLVRTTAAGLLIEIVLLAITLVDL